MSRIRKIAVAGGTFTVALGIGFVMQNGDVLAARFGNARPVDSLQSPTPTPAAMAVPIAAEPVLPAVAALPSVPAATMATQQQAGMAAAVILPTETAPPTMTGAEASPALAIAPEGSAPAPVPVALETAPEPAPEAAQQPAADPVCTVDMAAETGPAALVDLSLSAPCAPLARVTIHHQGMMFSLQTDSAGKARVTVPALTANSVFIADIDGSEGAVAMAEVPEIASFDRAVLQWQGVDGLQLHAREFGAGYGESGHVWAGAPGAAGLALDGTGGFLIELGDPAADNALLAQVYTFPTGTTARAGDVELTVEAEVTAANCGRDIAAQSIQLRPGSAPDAQDLTMTLPGCDAAGEFLVLSGMLSDIRLAAN